MTRREQPTPRSGGRRAAGLGAARPGTTVVPGPPKADSRLRVSARLCATIVGLHGGETSQ